MCCRFVEKLYLSDVDQIVLFDNILFILALHFKYIPLKIFDILIMPIELVFCEIFLPHLFQTACNFHICYVSITKFKIIELQNWIDCNGSFQSAFTDRMITSGILKIS